MPNLGLLEMFIDKRFNLALSLPLYREYWEVTEREKLNVDKDVREIVLKYLAKHCDRTEVHFKWRPFLKDENDNMVLETAVSSNADIVTHNMKDFAGVEKKFNVRVLKPQEVINECS